MVIPGLLQLLEDFGDFQDLLACPKVFGGMQRLDGMLLQNFN
jgi:hypothetical protein